MSCPIPANTLLTKTAQLTINGEYKNDSGAARDITFRVKINGTTVITASATAIPASASRKGWTASIYVIKTGTDAQKITAFIQGADFSFIGLQGTATADDAAVITVDVTAQLSAASASFDITRELAVLQAI